MQPPAPVPDPVPDESPGPPVIWAWADAQLQPSARLKTRVADFVRSRSVLNMRLIPGPDMLLTSIANRAAGAAGTSRTTNRNPIASRTRSMPCDRSQVKWDPPKLTLPVRKFASGCQSE